MAPGSRSTKWRSTHPVTNGHGQRSTVIRQVIDRAEHMLKPKVTTVEAPRHLT